jgi:hypothetical protein
VKKILLQSKTKETIKERRANAPISKSRKKTEEATKPSTMTPRLPRWNKVMVGAGTWSTDPASG